jgi:hypothetical protein
MSLRTAGDSLLRNPAARSDVRDGKLHILRRSLLASLRESIRQRRRAEGQHRSARAESAEDAESGWVELNILSPEFQEVGRQLGKMSR